MSVMTFNQVIWVNGKRLRQQTLLTIYNFLGKSRLTFSQKRKRRKKNLTRNIHNKKWKGICNQLIIFLNNLFPNEHQLKHSNVYTKWKGNQKQEMRRNIFSFLIVAAFHFIFTNIELMFGHITILLQVDSTKCQQMILK